MDWIFDSHAHYDSEAFDADRERLLQSLPGQGVCGVINCASDFASSESCLALAERYPYVYAAVGVPPHECAKEGWDEERLKALLARPKVVALGEIGLDYHYDFSPRGEQLLWFERQLKVAKELDLPVIVHDREAHADTMVLLQKYKPRGVIHCFSGSVEMAAEAVKLGMYIGLGGAVTFQNAKKPAEVAAAIPLERLLLETDAPYMTPVPFRGKRNDSAFIRYTAQRIAELRGAGIQSIYAAARQNACDLFGISDSVTLD